MGCANDAASVSEFPISSLTVVVWRTTSLKKEFAVKNYNIGLGSGEGEYRAVFCALCHRLPDPQ